MSEAGRLKNGAKPERTGARHLCKLGENAKAAQKKREAEGLDLHLPVVKLPVDDDGAARGKAVLHKFFAERTAHPASSCRRDARMMWRGRAVTGVQSRAVLCCHHAQTEINRGGGANFRLDAVRSFGDGILRYHTAFARSFKAAVSSGTQFPHTKKSTSVAL